MNRPTSTACALPVCHGPRGYLQVPHRYGPAPGTRFSVALGLGLVACGAILSVTTWARTFQRIGKHGSLGYADRPEPEWFGYFQDVIEAEAAKRAYPVLTAKRSA